MANTYTVDASVFLNAFNPYEKGHDVSHQLLAQLQERAVPIIVPTLVLPEVSAAVMRGRRDAGLARAFSSALARLPHLVLTPLDAVLGHEAADIAAQHAVRGSDAVYAAVARRFGCTLVTLDKEQKTRVAKIIPACSPFEALKQQAR